jgi:hypothetical protein
VIDEKDDLLIKAQTLLVAALDHVQKDETNPPAMVVFPPDDDSFIKGNQGGLLYLAIAALKAAGGEKQLLAKSGWVYQVDMDWGLKGFELDESAHLYIPERPSRIKAIAWQIAGYAIIIAICWIVVAGVLSISHWLWHPHF